MYVNVKIYFVLVEGYEKVNVYLKKIWVIQVCGFYFWIIGMWWFVYFIIVIYYIILC